MCGDVPQPFCDSYGERTIWKGSHRWVLPRLNTAVCRLRWPWRSWRAALDLTAVASAQQPGPTPPPVTAANPSTKLLSHVFDYLNIDTPDSGVFNPLIQRERTHRFGKSLINPVWYAKGALSAVQNQWRDIPGGMGAGSIEIRQTVRGHNGSSTLFAKPSPFGFESMVHEDNRYFPFAQNRFLVSNGICSIERYSRT